MRDTVQVSVNVVPPNGRIGVLFKAGKRSLTLMEAVHQSRLETALRRCCREVFEPGNVEGVRRES